MNSITRHCDSLVLTDLADRHFSGAKVGLHAKSLRSTNSIRPIVAKRPFSENLKKKI